MGMPSNVVATIPISIAPFTFSTRRTIVSAKPMRKMCIRDRDEVISPSEHKLFIYTEKNIRKRFFAKDRKLLLKEVEQNA